MLIVFGRPGCQQIICWLRMYPFTLYRCTKNNISCCHFGSSWLCLVVFKTHPTRPLLPARQRTEKHLVFSVLCDQWNVVVNRHKYSLIGKWVEGGCEPRTVWQLEFLSPVDMQVMAAVSCGNAKASTVLTYSRVFCHREKRRVLASCLWRYRSIKHLLCKTLMHG